jgi:hypothetical protein
VQGREEVASRLAPGGQLLWGGLADSYGSYTSTGGLYVPPFDPIFADGFESGDTAAWSSALP